MSETNHAFTESHATSRRPDYAPTALAAVSFAVVLVYALVYLGLWHGVVNLS